MPCLAPIYQAKICNEELTFRKGRIGGVKTKKLDLNLSHFFIESFSL